jgi:hypothetical protein
MSRCIVVFVLTDREVEGTADMTMLALWRRKDKYRGKITNETDFTLAQLNVGI